MNAAAVAASAVRGTLRDAGSGRFELIGAVTVATVAELRGLGRQAFASHAETIDIDLGALERVDSAGLALLIDWLAWAHAAGRAMKFSALPPALLALAQLSNVEELLVQC